jgi:hypothetical protein
LIEGMPGLSGLGRPEHRDHPENRQEHMYINSS